MTRGCGAYCRTDAHDCGGKPADGSHCIVSCEKGFPFPANPATFVRPDGSIAHKRTAQGSRLRAELCEPLLRIWQARASVKCVSNLAVV